MNPIYKEFCIKILMILGALFGMFILYTAREVIIIIGFALFLTLVLSPLLGRLHKWKIPDIFGILCIYVGIFLIGSVVILAMLPIFFQEIQRLFDFILEALNSPAPLNAVIHSEKIPGFISSIIEKIDIQSIFALLQENIGSIAKTFVSAASLMGGRGAAWFMAIGSGIANILLVLLLTFFFLLERANIRELFYKILPDNWSKYFLFRERKIEEIFTFWMRGQLLLSASIFSLTFVGLFILELAFGIHTEKKLALALIAGITEFIPYIGPLIALLPAVTMGLSFGPEMVLGIIIVYLVIQQFENNVLVPYLMGKTLNLSPAYTLVMTIVGMTLGGILGIVLALPLAAIFQIFYYDWIQMRNKKPMKQTSVGAKNSGVLGKKL